MWCTQLKSFELFITIVMLASAFCEHLQTIEILSTHVNFFYEGDNK